MNKKANGFREKGYTSESLRMLESEEGQLNAVLHVLGQRLSTVIFLKKHLVNFCWFTTKHLKTL